MKLTIKQLKKMIKEQVEEAWSDKDSSLDKTTEKEELSIYDIQEILETKPMAARWLNKAAKYDDAIIEDMPLELFTTLTGLTEEDIERINNNIEAYEGDISVHKTVTMRGGD